ncbi:MAG: hypothetical protein DHS20C15_23690 [Planctomycetota bacterium]|nr:MAG: hypothetical protein DHS20C15_23690 [Planctomycetota bacterium]
MFAPRFLAGLALAIASLTPLSAAQEVESIDLDTATLGDVIRVFGTDLGSKPKLVLVQDGELAKKTKLKVVGSGTLGEGVESDYVDVTLKKAFEGTFSIGLKVKKNIVSESEDTIDLVPPTVDSVAPESASPKQEVVMMVRDYGTVGAHKVFVGSKKAKITDVTVVDEGGSDPVTAVTFKVPKVANGNWPVSLQNRLGTGTLKNALEVTGSTGKVGGFSAVINFVGQKPFKAKKKFIGIDEALGDPDTVSVGLLSGSKKAPKAFGIQMPGLVADLEAGDMFTLSDDGAQILYTETAKDGTQCVWTSGVNAKGEDIAVQVVSIDDETMVLFVCGKIRFTPEGSDGECDGPAVLCFSGLVTAPSQEEEPVFNGPCQPFTDAIGSMTGAFEGDPQESIALADIGGPGTVRLTTGTEDGGEGFPAQVISFNVSFEPGTTATPATFDHIEVPSGDGITAFTLQLGLEIWSQKFDENLNSSMSVTITDYTAAPNNQFGILGCFTGSFTGTVSKGAGPTEMTQTLSGTFEIPLYDPGFGTVTGG